MFDAKGHHSKNIQMIQKRRLIIIILSFLKVPFVRSDIVINSSEGFSHYTATPHTPHTAASTTNSTQHLLLTNVGSSPCNDTNDQSECACPCDVSLGLCDDQCCCDLDCSNADIESFSHNDCDGERGAYSLATRSSIGGRKRRLNEQNEEDDAVDTHILQRKTFKCGENRRKDKLSNDKSKFDFQRLSDFIEDEMDQLLCLHHDNSAVQGEYFHHENDKLYTAALGRKTKINDFNFLPNEDKYKNADAFKRKAYSEGDFIHVKTTESHSMESSITTYFTDSKLSIPAAGDSLLCSFDDTVKFGIDVKSSCWVVIDDLERNCKHSLAIDQFVDNKMFVQKMNGPTYASSSTDDEFVRVEVEVIRSDKEEEIINFHPPYTVWEDNLGLCKHSLQGMKYEIYHDSSSIKKVMTKITWANVGSDTKSLRQDFEIMFISTNVEEESSNGGSSGYHFHAPILAGISDNAKKVQEVGKGLAIVNAGSCVNQMDSMAVGFGEDASVTCTLALSKDDLEDFCVSLNNEYLKRTGPDEQLFVPTWFIQNQDMIGIYVDSNPNKTEDWIAITSDMDNPGFVGKSRVWNTIQKQCTGMATAVRYRFYWTYSGQIDNPQAKILQVTVEHDSETPLIHKYHDEYKQNFLFTTTVSWTFIEPGKRVESLPLPNILFSVPDDVFYPFQSTSSQGGKLVPRLMRVLLSTLTAYALSEMI